MLLTRQRLEVTLARIEWTTLFFLLGLFVMVGALQETGRSPTPPMRSSDLTGGDRDVRAHRPTVGDAASPPA